MLNVARKFNSFTIDGFTSSTALLINTSEQNFRLVFFSCRQYFGRGLQLDYKNGQVFAKCVSQNPVFIQSSFCNQRCNWHPDKVLKIPTGCSLKVFDEAEFMNLANETVGQGIEGVSVLNMMCVIKISFVEGWGSDCRFIENIQINSIIFCLYNLCVTSYHR